MSRRNPTISATIKPEHVFAMIEAFMTAATSRSGSYGVVTALKTVTVAIDVGNASTAVCPVVDPGAFKRLLVNAAGFCTGVSLQRRDKGAYALRLVTNKLAPSWLTSVRLKVNVFDVTTTRSFGPKNATAFGTAFDTEFELCGRRGESSFVLPTKPMCRKLLEVFQPSTYADDANSLRSTLDITAADFEALFVESVNHPISPDVQRSLIRTVQNSVVSPAGFFNVFVPRLATLPKSTAPKPTWGRSNRAFIHTAGGGLSVTTDRETIAAHGLLASYIDLTRQGAIKHFIVSTPPRATGEISVSYMENGGGKAGYFGRNLEFGLQLRVNAPNVACVDDVYSAVTHGSPRTLAGNRNFLATGDPDELIAKTGTGKSTDWARLGKGSRLGEIVGQYIPYNETFVNIGNVGAARVVKLWRTPEGTAHYQPASEWFVWKPGVVVNYTRTPIMVKPLKHITLTLAEDVSDFEARRRAKKSPVNTESTPAPAFRG